MGKRKEPLNEMDLIDLWMIPIHGLSIEEAFEEKPWTDSRDFYSRYQVTQEQHDKWYDEAIDKISKYYRMSKKVVKKGFGFLYLNCSPMVINENKDEE